MPSIFQYAVQTPHEDPQEEINPLFSEIKQAKQDNIIPPVGIAKPELVESFLQNMGDEEKIREDIREAEKYERETKIETAKREFLSHAARGAEGWLGGVNSFINLFTEYENAEGLQGHFPNAEELHEKTKSLTGKYLEPKTERGKQSQETVSDIGSMFSVPGMSLMQKLALPIGGQFFKQLLKKEGYSEKVQDAGKLGFMTMASIAQMGNAPAVASQALQQAENMIPRGLSFNASLTRQALNRIRNSSWHRSGATPSKAAAMAEIERIEAQINNGMIDGHMAMQLRRDINEARRQLGGFQLNRPVNRRQALRYLDEVDGALMESMNSYGRNVNPNWLRQYELGNEAFRITQRSGLISDVIENMGKPLKSEMAKVLYHVGGSAALSKLPILGVAALPVAATAKTIQIMNRMIRSSVLRNHYLDVIRASATGNSALILKSIEKFDATAQKLENKKNQNSSSEEE